MSLTPQPPEPRTPVRHAAPWPAIDLRQVRRMTDDTGILQHAVFATPDANHGYCIDDNARALIAAVRLAELGELNPTGEPGGETLPLHRYLQFVHYAFNPDQGGVGRFRNFMGYDRRWLEDAGSEDSQARALWALGEAVAHGPTPNVRDLAATVWGWALPGVRAVGSPRSLAFGAMGVARFLERRPGDEYASEALGDLAQRLWAMLKRGRDWASSHGDADWCWWEDVVSYDNAKLPHGLLLAGVVLDEPGMRDDALAALRWLVDVQTQDADTTDAEHLSIIGNDGWLRRGQGPAARFDQQPLEAYALVDACLKAARSCEGDDAQRWESDAWRCFGWFRGANDLGLDLIDPETGGCRDGLNPQGVNRNQGAESILAYVLATLELHRHEQRRPGFCGRVTRPG